MQQKMAEQKAQLARRKAARLQRQKEAEEAEAAKNAEPKAGAATTIPMTNVAAHDGQHASAEENGVQVEWAVGDRVRVIKEGSHQGEEGTIADPLWGKRVKVTMDAQDETKSYLHAELRNLTRDGQAEGVAAPVPPPISVGAPTPAANSETVGSKVTSPMQQRIEAMRARASALMDEASKLKQQTKDKASPGAELAPAAAPAAAITSASASSPTPSTQDRFSKAMGRAKAVLALGNKGAAANGKQ
jgi:hypothetical protein